MTLKLLGGEICMDTITKDTLFLDACGKVIDIDRHRKGIGTLKEKTIHAVLKHYFEPREEFHEIPIDGFVADIQTPHGVIEIQTGSFQSIRKKLEVFLANGPVTIVYPIPHIKWLRWINEDTGEMTEKRKSPKKGTPYMSFFELYKIKQFLTHPNLIICIILIDMVEYRSLNGWSLDKKRGSSRYDRIPTGLAAELWIGSKADYVKLVPDSLVGEFNSKDYKKATGLTLSAAQTALNVLNYMGAVERCGKAGRSYLYEVKK